MKKAKRLHTCPGCGARNLVNLKTHKCKAIAATRPVFELVKPASQKVLVECAENIQRVQSKVVTKTGAYYDDVIYDCAEIGIYFLRAKESLDHGQFEDFVKSATVADLSLRTARNYMNAARNAGLTAESTADDVAALRKAKALHGRKPTDLYQLKDAGEEEEQPSETKWNLIRDTAVSLREQCESVLAIRDQLNKKAFSTVCARLQRTLEDLTGSTWDMVKQRKGDPHFKEHGDVYEIGS